MIPFLSKSVEADNWTYLAEGNLNLVVIYRGSDPDYKGKVLRVVKSSKNEKEPTQDTVIFKKQFSEKVIRQLLGEDYVVPMFPVHTSVEFLQQLAYNVEPHRPTFRTSRQIVVDLPTSFILPDLTQVWSKSPTLTFELKPKWGFKPNSSFINDLNSNKKRTTCRFCMHSYLKLISQDFCPLDLYSVDLERVRKAVNALLETPLQKTLSVSINGKKISPESEMNQQLFVAFVKYDGNYNALLQDILVHILINDPILRILKNLQERLDELDVEGIYALCQNNTDHYALVTDDINVWMDVVDRFQRRCQMNTPFKSDSIQQIDEQRQRIYEYILSMTFKDCSLMINVTPNTAINTKTITLSNGLSFQYEIKVIDTDLKNIKKIPYWFDLDQSIVKNALETKFDKECL
ncbi:inositol-pentakisphosphate 2-kinase [Pilaira anomala]|nr:inositol-pentakisphosphate 2-kinase [Pilaira anomala]